jgi:hypothetical protein
MSNPTPWKSIVRKVSDGEAVKASVTNRSADDVTQRTQHLKERLDNALLGQAIVIPEAQLNPNVEVGHAVYKATNGFWYRALAEVEVDSATGIFTLKPSGFVLGVVTSKITNTLGQVILFGYADDIDLSSVIEGGITTGEYYLSSNTPGRITSTRPSIGIPVLYYIDATHEIFVNPSPRDVLEDHIHFSIELYNNPAGIIKCIDEGETHVIQCPDENELGWLPADHEIFEGNAPTNAKFGYNLTLHSELNALWPPLPVEGTYLELDGVGLSVGHESDDSTSQVVINRHGIWWMSNCYGKAPWEDPYVECALDDDCLSIAVDDISYYGYYGPDTCPTDFARKLILRSTRMVYKTDNTVVSSLEPAADAPLVIKNTFGADAKTGALTIDLAPNIFSIDDETFAGYQVITGIADRVLKRGLIVGSLKPLSSRVKITGGTGDASSGYRGNLSIDLVDPFSSSGRELDIQLIGLAQATEENYQDILFLSFPNSQDSYLLLKTIIPSGGTGTLKIVLWLMPTTTGNLPAITANYCKIAEPSNVPLTLSTSYTNISPAIDGSTVTAYNYMKYETSSFNVTAGDIVFLKLSRAGSTDGFAGLVGILKVAPVLTVT